MNSATQPLAERLRPKKLDDYVGQKHLLGLNGPLRNMLEQKAMPSLILWGPPGVGKTTLALLLSQTLDRDFYSLSAVSAGVKDVRDVLDRVQKGGLFGKSSPILFIDEIHRFSKSQQDALLAAVEKGVVTLIGATTENPSFEVIAPLLSRCQVYVLEALGQEDLKQLTQHALEKDVLLKSKTVCIEEWEALLRLSGGDARKLLNTLELLVLSTPGQEVVITNKLVLDSVSTNMALYDKNGEQHFDQVSAFIKSMRGSDPNAALYWMARMLKGGEDPIFIARRMLILASEDIGNANPNALLLAQSCFQAVSEIGMPEARIILAQAAVYLASSPKSNASYMGIAQAFDWIDKTGDLPVPLHLRNAPTRLMKQLGYGKDYKYSHNYSEDDADAFQDFLPSELSGKAMYMPGNNAREKEIRHYLRGIWKEHYGY
jgi:putative ATPase